MPKKMIVKCPIIYSLNEDIVLVNVFMIFWISQIQHNHFFIFYRYDLIVKNITTK